ncbi:LPXTG cell wall anchor domain-containing protein [Mumia zhuanghuii]|uniref:LPXTG cell wall anchor domain-containing protein n=2 Tax=Mumia TaxID=1546255 RepID=A0ABW1QHI7_9ACTN|nr:MULTISPECIES: LPXTG cell wall anchor domain-containing protein [Mumia]KAA1422696.1 LPXTG cell wall anchor domain-containing protein [Mumia zhuanghuii]
MKKFLVLAVAILLSVGIQVNVAAYADGESGDSAAPAQAESDAPKDEEPDPKAAEEPAEPKAPDEPAEPQKDEPAEPKKDEPAEPKDEAPKGDGKDDSSEAPAKDESAAEPDESPSSEPATDDQPKPKKQKAKAQAAAAFEPYEVEVWWRMARVSDTAVWDSPQIYAGTSRPAATCKPVSYQVDSYNIEDQADEDLLNELKAKGLSAPGQDSALDPAPWRFVTVKDPYSCGPEVTPVTPTVVQAICTGPGQYTPPSITLPLDTDLLTYSLRELGTNLPVTAVEPGKTYVVRAVLDDTADPRPEFVDLPDGWVVNGGYGYAELKITITVPDCGDSATPPEPAWVDDCGPGNGHWEFTDTEAYSYTETVNEDGSITIKATPNEGYEFPEGTVTEWTETDSNEPCVVEAPPPVWTDDCETVGSWAVPPDGEHYHYEVTEGTDGSQTVTLVVDEGYTLPPGSVMTWTETEDAGDCDLLPGDIESQCVSAVPYLSYAVTLPPGLTDPGANPVTITFVNPDGDDYVVSGLPLNGRLLWPGASATEPLQWPGWELLEDGTYVETDGNFAWTRQGITVRFDVNPTYSTTVQYPSETSACANPPKRVPENPDNPDNPDTPDTPVGYNPPPTGSTPPLPNTGGTSLVPAVLGALLALTGGLVLGLRRRLSS